MYTTPCQCFMALKSSLVRTNGINAIHLCYAGETATINKDKTVTQSDGWPDLGDYHVYVAQAFIEDKELYIILSDASDDGKDRMFSGKLDELGYVLSTSVLCDWNVGVQLGKWAYDEGKPTIKGMVITAPNSLFIY